MSVFLSVSYKTGQDMTEEELEEQRILDEKMERRKKFFDIAVYAGFAAL